MVIAKQQEAAGIASTEKIVGSILKEEVCWRGRFGFGFSSSRVVQESIKLVQDCHDYCALMTVLPSVFLHQEAPSG